MESFVALNIFDGEKILNKNQVPILYYWNGETDFIEDMKSDKDFVEFLKIKLCNINSYGDAKIAYFYFTMENGEEKCVNKTDMIQSWFTINELPGLVNEYIKHYFNYLYVCSYKEDYKFTNDFNLDICNIYDSIKDKYPAKIAKTTVINYVRSELLNTNHLLTDTINYIIDNIEKILIDKN